MKKIAIMLAVCLLSVALFAQTSDVLSLEDAIALYEDDMTLRGDGNRVIEIIKELVSEGINALGDYDNTPLMFASMYGYTEIVASLIEAGADLEANYERGTALSRTAGFGHTEIVKILIEAGANLEGCNYFGITALIDATITGHTEIVKVLIKAGADLDRAALGGPALLYAAYNGHIEIVKLLLDAGAEVNASDDDDRTALSLATEYGHTDIVALLEKGRTAFQEIGKAYRTTDNLRLRQNEGTAGTPLFTLPKGASIKILAQGNEETIDGIRANWVQVEVLRDTVSVQGDRIKAGAVGWCFGGYLGEL